MPHCQTPHLNISRCSPWGVHSGFHSDSSFLSATGFSSKKTSTEARDFSLTSQLKSWDDSFMIKTVLPELAATWVGGIRFTTVKAISRMRARFPICGRWHRWHMVWLTFAASHKGIMVGFAMWSHTDRTHHVDRSAIVKVVAPTRAARAERNTYFRWSPSEKAYRATCIDRSIYECTHLRSFLRIPYVEVNDARVCRPQVANDPRRSSQADVVFVDRVEEDAFSVHRCQVVPTCVDEGNIDEFADGMGGWYLAFHCGAFRDDTSHEGFHLRKFRGGGDLSSRDC